MNGSQDLTELEAAAHRRAYSDVVIDLFLGLSLVWIGATWIWLPDLAGVAGVLPAVLVVSMLEVRKRLVEARLGYVIWAAPRRNWQQCNFAVVLASGVALFLLGLGAFVVVNQTSADSSLLDIIMPGLLAWLLAALALGLGLMMGVARMLGYATVLAVGGILTSWAEGNPGWPLLAAGIVVSFTGVAMLARFVTKNPVARTL